MALCLKPCFVSETCRLQEEILQKEEAENNLAAFRAVCPTLIFCTFPNKYSVGGERLRCFRHAEEGYLLLDKGC